MLWHPKTLQNLAMYNVFFIFGRFSIAGKLPKWPKIPFQYPLALRHPKILEKCRKHHRILVSVRNRFWGLVSVRNRFWPPPPAKADIATAILTNVIEHLVLLLPPNKHAFTAKAVWADFYISTGFATPRALVAQGILHQFNLMRERTHQKQVWTCTVPFEIRLRAASKAAVNLPTATKSWMSFDCNCSSIIPKLPKLFFDLARCHLMIKMFQSTTPLKKKYNHLQMQDKKP